MCPFTKGILIGKKVKADAVDFVILRAGYGQYVSQNSAKITDAFVI